MAAFRLGSCRSLFGQRRARLCSHRCQWRFHPAISLRNQGREERRRMRRGVQLISGAMRRPTLSAFQSLKVMLPLDAVIAAGAETASPETTSGSRRGRDRRGRASRQAPCRRRRLSRRASHGSQRDSRAGVCSKPQKQGWSNGSFVLRMTASSELLTRAAHLPETPPTG